MKIEQPSLLYFSNGKTKLFEVYLDGTQKKPRISNWPNVVMEEEELLTKLSKGVRNFGLALSDGELVIDVDVRSGGLESYEHLRKEYPELSKFEPTVVTPTGGHHYYFSIPAGVNIRRKLEDYQGIDFLTKGCYVVIAGTSFDGGKTSYQLKDENFFSNMLPIDLLEDLRYTDRAQESSDEEYVRPGQDEVERALSYISPNVDYATWIKIGMALYSWDSSEIGFTIYNEWSKKGITYKEHEMSGKWDSFSTIERVSIRTLFMYSKEAKALKAQAELTPIIDKIRRVDKYNLKEEIKEILKDNYNLYLKNKEIIENSIRKAFKTKLEVNLSVKEMNELIPKAEEKADWLKNWVWVSDFNKFYRVTDNTFHTDKGFNIENNRYTSSMGMTASNYISKNDILQRVVSLTYDPQADKGVIYNKDSNRILYNSYEDKVFRKVPNISEETPSIKMFLRHLTFITSTQEEADILLYWIAHNIQKKGVLIKWAPIIYGIQGTGKSYIGSLLKLLLGEQNVMYIEPSDVRSEYKTWAKGHLVNVFTELKLSGENRYEVANTIKPYITDDYVSVREMYVQKYEVKNVSNYIALTNHIDCIPFEASDRRWYPVKGKYNNMKDFEDALGLRGKEYFPKLYGFIYSKTEEYYTFLSELEIPKWFKDQQVAPKSDFKKVMIETEKKSQEGYSEIENIIEDGRNIYCSSDRIVFQVLLNEIEKEGLMIPHHKVTSILKKLGYVASRKVENLVLYDRKIKGSIWINPTKENMESENE